MKNKKVLIVLIIVILLLIGAFLLLPKEEKDSKKFRNDYSNLNIEKNNPIVYLNDQNLISELSTKDKLVFLGRPSSEETKKAIPILLRAAKDNGIDKIYYYDLTNIAEKEDIVNDLTGKLEREGIVAPTLFLLKDKKVSEIQEGFVKDLESKYEDIMISYIMCNTPNC